MGLLDRFFGRKKDKVAGTPDPGPAANPALERPLGLQVVFESPPAWDAGRLTGLLRRYAPATAAGTFEVMSETADPGTVGLAAWGEHVVQLVSIAAPMPAEVVEACVAPSHYGDDLKARARANVAHALLYYAGRAEDPLEQYVALAAVAGVLAEVGAVVVLNEAAHTSFPAAALRANQADPADAADRAAGDMVEQLRALPLLILYCGFVKYDVEGVRGVWMRTYGCPLLGLPDLATLAAGHHEGQRTFDLFGNILDYLRDSGAEFDVGHTMQVGQDTFMRVRAPRKEEYFLDSPGQLFVAEFIGADEINRR